MHRYRHRYTFPAIIVLLVLALAGIIFAFMNSHKNTTVPRGANMSVLGIELDQNKDNIDLHELQQNGISFVYLRSTQGKSYFDDNFLMYRDKVKGTDLSYGTIITFSNQSSVNDQYQYFMKKVGQDTGNLPIMIVPAINTDNSKFWKDMGRFSNLLTSQGKKVLIAGPYQEKKYFPQGTQFLYTGASLKNKKEYAFWCYTQAGRVKNVEYLDSDVTMFAYIGSMANYQQLYGANITQ